MRATVEATPLPFRGHTGKSTTPEAANEQDQGFSLALRYTHIPFHKNDRLLVLHGHPIVFRLGLHITAQRVVAGQSVLYVDGASTFDPFAIGRLARASHRQPRAVLSMIHVARAFTGHQMERLVCDCLESAMNRYDAKTAILSGLFETFYDHAVQEQDALRSFGRILRTVIRMTQQGYRLLCLCPSAPILTPVSRRCFGHLAVQADRVIRVQQDSGILRLEEQRRTHATPEIWEMPPSALDLG